MPQPKFKRYKKKKKGRKKNPTLNCDTTDQAGLNNELKSIVLHAL